MKATGLFCAILALTIFRPLPANAQGPITSGEFLPGAISAAGEVDTWTFSANAGDSIVVRAGTVGFAPSVRLFGPGNVLLATSGNPLTGIRDGEAGFRATNSGPFSVTVSSYYAGGTGTYNLSLAKSPATITVTPGDEGGPLTNGWKHSGTIAVGDLDVWGFTATAGDSIVVRMGCTNFAPRVRIFGPDGGLQAVSANALTGTRDAEAVFRATNSGPFVVVLNSYYENGTGPYSVSLVKTPGAISVAPGDEGGPLTIGWKHTGTIDVGDLDAWTFTANTGDSVVVRMGCTNFAPRVRIYGPDGGLQAINSNPLTGTRDGEAVFRATNSGPFTVVVNAYYANGSGNYILSLAKSPGTVSVTPGDEGGPLTNGWKHTGVIEVGDLDAWDFTANAGDSVVVRMGCTNFAPRVRIYGPDGGLQAVSANPLTGVRDAEAVFRATNSGPFIVVVNSYYENGTGPYALSMVKTPGAFSVAPGDEGGLLSNGWKHAGNIDVGDLDAWSFTANTGDSVVVRMGTTAYAPRVRIYGPDGGLQAISANPLTGTRDVEATFRATNSGPFTVVVNSYYENGSGSYILTLAKAPGAIDVAPGDEGGPLTNGWLHTGVIDVGDLDVWNFTAAAGDSIVLRMGSVGYAPWIRLYGPDGTLLTTSGNPLTGVRVGEASFRATNSGPFTVVVGAYYGGGTGSYSLNLAKSPGEFFIAPGDDGGVLTNGINHDGTITLGDLDIWKFCASVSNNVLLQITELVDTSANFTPWIRLYGPDGTLLNSASGAASAQISRTVTNSGMFTVVVGDGNSGLTGLGTYRLTATGIFTCASVVLDCSLTPPLSTNFVGTSHTVTDFVTTNANPAVGAVVIFNVISGPNAGQSATNNTAANGQAIFTYIGGPTPGTDVIRAIASIPGASVTCTATRLWNALPPEAAFNASPTAGAAPLLVNFTDASTGTITNRLWNFGDTGTSTLASPSHTYSNAGVYSVSLTVFGPGGSSLTNAVNLITVTNVAPVAGFAASPTNGAAPLLVFFTDASTGTITNRLWAFGDGATSGGTSPTHTYTTAGVYSVNLTVTGPGGSDAAGTVITVTNVVPVADFTASPTNGFAPLQVDFTDASTGTITNRLWDFGDGAFSTATNPSHTYTNAGSYSVTLTVFGPTGNDSLTQPQLIEVATPPVTADLELTKIGLPSPVFIASNLTYTITVTNRGPGTATSITVTDALPASVTFVAASDECTNIAGIVICDFGSLNNNAATNITIVVMPTQEAMLTNIASVAAAESDPNLTNNAAAAVTRVMAVPPPIPHDLAVVKLKAPKRIVLTTKAASKVGKFSVTIQNQSTQTEIIPNLATLNALLMVEVETLGTNCESFAATLVPPRASFPISLAPNKKLTLAFQATFNCFNDRLATTKSAVHDDYSSVAVVDLSALGEIDTADLNDVCPRPSNPATGDPGCGNKTSSGALGADVLTDVIVK